MSGVANEVSLKYFCVCNVSLGQKEGEEEKKILYYFPKGTHVDIQIKETGLCQAIIKFSQTFSTDPCDSVITEKTKRVLYEAEPNYWFIMGVCGGRYVEGLKSVLIQCYESVRMFLGPLERLASKSNDSLKRSLEPLLTKYLVSAVVGKLVTRSPCEVFRGLQFLPLDRTPFLQAISILNRIESNHPSVHYSLLLHSDSLVWSGLPAEETQVVFRYLTISLLPTFLVQEKQNKSPLDPDSSTTNGRFVCGPKSQSDLVIVKRLPRLYLHNCSLSDESSSGFYHMIVYRLPMTTVAWFLKDGTDPSMELFRSLEKACREEIGPLVNGFKLESDGCGGGPSSSSSFSTDNDTRYVYFNKMNLAVKAQPQQSHVNSLTMSLYSHHERLVDEGCSSIESIAKTVKENWVSARSSNSRHFFLTSDKRKYNLHDFNLEVNRICDKQLSTIFFHV